MRRILLLFVFIPCSFLATKTARGSHISGGEITYQCLGANQYKITLTLFRDCSGIDMLAAETLNISSSCTTMTVSANLINPGGTEVSQICNSQIGTSTCNGGSLAGMEKYIYEATVTLVPCADWEFTWTTCCRNATVNVPTSTGDGSYIEATLNSTVDNCNISPAFFAQPIPSVCINQPVTYNLSASDNDGDSLVFSFIAARNDAGASLVYTSPYSATNPINGITINQSTGTINFTPTTLGNFIVAVQVAEYDTSGILIGTVMRDIQFMVVNCSGNTPPNPSAGTISGLTGTAVATGPYSLQLCPGGNFSFSVQVNDTNASDSVSLTSDITSFFPGAVFSSAGGNPATATISWTDTGTFTGTRNFVINAKDNVCPIPGVQTFVYSVTINQGTFAGENASICGTQQVQLSASGGTSFQWTAISGDPIVVGTNFSCNPCANPVAGPDTTTVYVVTSNLTGGCTNKDTVIITVVPDFTYTKAQSKTAVCMQEQVQFTVTASGSYTYQWSPAGLFNNDTISNPIATFGISGINKVYFTITNSSGCSKTDSMSVAVSTDIKPDVFILADSNICAGDSVPMQAVITNASPLSCGLSAGSCQGSPAQITVGTGANVLPNTSYPAPYGHWYMGVKHQILVRAAELQALGFSGGQVSSLALNIASISGTISYKNFEIKMGCTADSALSTWTAGLVTVFPAQTITIATGWNFHNFSNSFDWDGSSNVVVEICFNNQPDPYTFNSPTYYTATTFNSVIYYNADNNPTVCSSPQFLTASTERPNMLFSVCSGGSGNSGYSYAWSPAFGLNDATVANPVATISSDTTYSVIVTDTIGGCADTASISLQVVPNFTYTFSQSDSLICENDPVQFSVLPSAPGSYVYDWEPGYLFSDTLISDPVAVFDSAGTNIIFFEVSNAGGCTKSDSISLLVLSSPGLMVTGDLDICENDSAQLTASGGMSYTWNPPSGLNDPDISNPKASPDSTTTYSITATGANGCTSAGSVQVIVFPLPDIALGDDTAFCDSITLDAGSGFISYLWSTGSTAPSITVTTPGTYSVAVKDSMGCTNKDTININGSGLLAQVTNAPANMCITDNSITLSGSPPGGTFIGPGTTTGGVFSPALAGLGSHNIIYFVNVNGCLDEDTATITVDSCLVGANVIRPRETQFHVYPNPNNGRFVLEFSSHPSTECYLKMYNGAGAVVHQSQIKNLKTEIAPGNLTPGVYLLQLIHEAGIINRKILVE